MTYLKLCKIIIAWFQFTLITNKLMQACNISIIHWILHINIQSFFFTLFFHNIFNIYIYISIISILLNIYSSIQLKCRISYFIYNLILNVFLSKHTLTNQFYLLLITNIIYTFILLARSLKKFRSYLAISVESAGNHLMCPFGRRADALCAVEEGIEGRLRYKIPMHRNLEGS